MCAANAGAHMPEDDILATHFLYPIERIRVLRHVDEKFDAMCADFLILAEEVSRTVATGKPGSVHYLADATASLSGLTDEIEAKLQVLTGTEPPKPKSNKE
jgi:hypothetical protein